MVPTLISSISGVATPSPHRLGGAGAGADRGEYSNSTVGISHGLPTPDVDTPSIPIFRVPVLSPGTVSCATTAPVDGPLFGSRKNIAPLVTLSALVSLHCV